MLFTILGILLIGLGLLSLALQRFYSSVPAKELKRLAARGDHLAAALYSPVAFGASMRLLLWILFCVSMTTGFVLVMSGLVTGLAFVVILLSVAASILVQSVRLTVRSAHFAVKTAPALNWVLVRIHKPFDSVSSAANRYRKHAAHSGLYEKEDILDLIGQQREQSDNRIDAHDLQLLANAVQFDDRHAADIVTPMSRIKPVSVEEHIGPVLLGELHASGQNSFLIYEESPDHVVGTLFLRDAVQAKEGGRVGNLMHPRICYVHEDFSLRQVLQAFTHTGQFMVVVINAFEEPAGVITLQHLLQQLVGEREDSDFDAFENRSAVAAFTPPLPEPIEPEEIPEPAHASPEETEVVQ